MEAKQKGMEVTRKGMESNVDHRTPKYQFDYMWGNFDRLLQLLPPADVVDLNFQFMKLIQEKINRK